jgi:phage terminase large subunit-like protein
VASIPSAASRADAADAIYLASSYELVPDEWQEFVLNGWLGTRADGRWASPRCGLSLARQNGKNALLEMRILYGMLMLGERVLHTAHEVKTAQRAFARLLYFFDNPRRFPKLHARCRTIRRANGQEAVFLDNGGSFQVVARSKNSGRGFSADVLVMDEAQELAGDALAALLPTVSASKNPQTFYTGTPPGPNADGSIFARQRDLGRSGIDDRLCWIEWCADESVDIDDRAGWAAANPALGIRLDAATIGDEYDQMDEDTFRRERLGIWNGGTSGRVISADRWHVCADTKLRDVGGQVAVSIDVSPDRSSATIASASWTTDGVPYVDVVETRRGEPDWGIEKFVQICARHEVRAVVIDGSAAATTLVDPLRQQGVTVTAIQRSQMAKACGGFYDAVMDGQLKHLDQPSLNVALSVARRRAIGDGGWGWSRRDSDADITPIVASTLALWGLTSGEIDAQPRKRTGKAVFV